MAAELQATLPHRFNPVQAQSPHLLLPPINPPPPNRQQMTSPVHLHPYVTSSFEPQPRLISPPFEAQPQPSSAALLSPPHHAYSQNHDPDWTGSSELSHHWRSDTFSYQVRFCSVSKTEKKKKCSQKCLHLISTLKPESPPAESKPPKHKSDSPSRSARLPSQTVLQHPDSTHQCCLPAA